MAESSKVYAEDKEVEVKLLERSVEELECTVNALENKVSFEFILIQYHSFQITLFMFTISCKILSIRLILLREKLNDKDCREKSSNWNLIL